MPRAVPRSPRPVLPPPPSDSGVLGGVVSTPGDVGAVVRWVRGVRQLPLDRLAAGTGVSQDLLRGLEKADRNVGIAAAMDVLASLGFDLVLVPRDPALGLAGPERAPDTRTR